MSSFVQDTGAGLGVGRDGWIDRRKGKGKEQRGKGGLMDFSVLHPISGGHTDLTFYLFWQTPQSSGKRVSSAENREVGV